MGTPLTIARELLSQSAKFTFCHYSLQLLRLSFSSIRSHHPTRDDPGAPMVALSRALDEVDVAISVRDCMESEHALGSFSFFEHLRFQVVPANTFNALQHLGKSE